MMQKRKKIGIKHYLNTKLKPIIDENNVAHYPIYIQITYDKRTYSIKSKMPFGYFSTENFEGVFINQTRFSNQEFALMRIEKDKKIITKIIEEITNYDSKILDFQALINLYELYSTKVIEIQKKFLAKKLLDNDDFYYLPETKLYLEISNFLMTYSTFERLIYFDWIQENLQSKFEFFMKDTKKYDSEEIGYILILLNISFNEFINTPFKSA